MIDFLAVINAGSSSVKFAVYRLESSVSFGLKVNGHVEGIGNQARFKVKSPQDGILVDKLLSAAESGHHTVAVRIICNWLLDYLKEGRLLAAGHRVVHGGLDYSAPVLINEKVLSDLETLIPLAPLHQPHNLEAIRAFLDIMPDLPQVACFDTAFHRTQSDLAQRFALPQRFYNEGVRRYGFHGLSYEYVSSILPSLDPMLTGARVIIAHLGSGASLCAIHHGSSIASTMGFSPLDGLVMGTRCGNIDPGALLYLMTHYKMDVRELEHLLYHESGLFGVSGLSNDMRILLASDDPYAREAIDLFVYRAGRELGSLTAVLGGFDALVFTGGIGEHSAEIRARICRQWQWLGLELDDSANAESRQRISKASSKIAAWVVKTDENWIIAHHTCRHLNGFKGLEKNLFC